VQSLSTSRHHYLLASRAIGEQGIAAFLLGDIATAKKDVLKARMIAKVADPDAHIRYASMYGTGLVELHKYKEAIGPLDEAISLNHFISLAVAEKTNRIENQAKSSANSDARSGP
jgi:hypothetical protein